MVSNKYFLRPLFPKGIWSAVLILGFISLATLAQSQEVERMLVAAAANGRLAEVQQLLGNDFDLAKSGALAAAVSGGHLEVVKYLIEKGADPNRLLVHRGFETPPIFVAAKDGRPEMLEYVIAHGADLNYESPGETSINTPLIAAIYYGDLDTARLLLRYGADVNYVSKHGGMALYQAIRYSGGDKFSEFVELLLSHGADPDIPDRAGITARELAKSSRHTELIALIEGSRPTSPGAVVVGASDIEAMTMILLTKEFCDEGLPGFREKSAPAYRAWLDENAVLIDRIRKSPAFEEKANAMREGENESPEIAARAQDKWYIRDMEELCEDGVLTYLATDPMSGPNPKLATPELAWAHFQESLRNGDRGAALSCLAANARRNFKEIIKEGTDEKLRRMADSIEHFEVTGVKFDNVVEGVVVRHDGRAGLIYLQNHDGEWRITEM